MKPRVLLAACAALLPLQAARADFAVAVSPPRFELESSGGEVLRQVMEITNASRAPGNYRMRTADWTYAADGTVEFQDELAPGSCRPWVALERRELRVPPGRPYRFRFEVSPPPTAAALECRFAVLIEGEEESMTSGGVTMPFNARVAVIVYLAVAGAQPKLVVTGQTLQPVDGRLVPALRVRNEGMAHGRLGGFLQGRDAGQARLDFTASTSPILPGETRVIPLLPSRPGEPDAPVQLQYPVTVRGRLEWGKGQGQDMDLSFTR